MRVFGSFVYLLALALLVGGCALYTFVLTPAIFASYPRNTAGGIVGTMMPGYFKYQLATLALATVALAVLWRSWPRDRRALCLVLLLAGVVVQLFVNRRLYPQILAVKGRVASFESAPDAPERRRFRALHKVSMLLNLLTLADGTVLLALIPPRGRSTTDTVA